MGHQGDTFVIDPYDPSQLIPLINDAGGHLKGIINTHEHADHTCGNKGLQKEFPAPIYAHYNARGKIASVDHFLQQGHKIDIDDSHKFFVMDTPGHTLSHLSLLLLKNEQPIAVFTGDTIFNAGVGNCHHGGDPTILYETIRNQILTLPNNVLIYPGHEYLGNNLQFTLHYWPSNINAKRKYKSYKKVDPDKTFFVTTVGEEKKINLFLTSDHKYFIDNLGANLKTPKHIFLKLRELRDKW